MTDDAAARLLYEGQRPTYAPPWEQLDPAARMVLTRQAAPLVALIRLLAAEGRGGTP